MKLRRLIEAFRHGELGVVAVEWVILSAAVIGLAIAVLAVIRVGVEDLSKDIASQLINTRIDTTMKP